MAACVAAMYRPYRPDATPPDVRLLETATRQVRELIKEADTYEYVFCGPPKLLPHTTGLVAPKSSVEAFNRWYLATFHGR